MFGNALCARLSHVLASRTQQLTSPFATKREFFLHRQQLQAILRQLALSKAPRLPNSGSSTSYEYTSIPARSLHRPIHCLGLRPSIYNLPTGEDCGTRPFGALVPMVYQAIPKLHFRPLAIARSQRTIWCQRREPPENTRCLGGVAVHQYGHCYAMGGWEAAAAGPVGS